MAEPNNSKVTPKFYIKGDGKAAKLGDRFEILILAHFAIICALDEEYDGKNLHITFNASDLIPLDDIVILTDDELTLVQLKHKANSGNIVIQYADYEKAYNNIILPKYQQEMKAGFKVNVVVFSNAKVLIPKNMKVVQSSNIKLNKFNTCAKGQIFQLENQKSPSQTSAFFKNLHIFSQQSFATDINMLSNNFKVKLDKEQIGAIYDYFNRSVVGRTKPFTTNEILSVLNECILKPSVIFNSSSEYTLNNCVINLFETVFENNKLLVVTEKYKTFFVSLFNQCIKSYSKFTINNYKDNIVDDDLDDDIKQSLSSKKNPYTFEDLAIGLWQLGKSPIVINYSDYQEQIDFTLDNLMNNNCEGPIVMIVEDDQKSSPVNATKLDSTSIFQNADENTKVDLLENTTMTVGPGPRNLKNLIGAVDTITPHILLSILNHSLTINSINKPEIYLSRRLKIKLLSESAFEADNFLFVVHHDPSKLDMEQFLKNPSQYQNVNVINSKLSARETKDKIATIATNFCCLQRTKDKYLMYAHRGPLKGLDKHWEETELDENELVKGPSFVTKVISGDAGMGKTCLMEQLGLKLYDMGKLPIYLSLGSAYELEQSNRSNVINYLARLLSNFHEGTIKFLEGVIEYNIKRENLVLLLDGFDEGKLEYTIINFLSSLGVQVIVSTRTHKLQAILKNCECLHFSLVTFSHADQKEFLQLKYDNEDNDKMEEMIRVLKKNVDESLMGIPLQIKHVVEIFPNIDDFLTKKNEINLLFLYDTFINKHLSQSTKARQFLIYKLACRFLLGPTLLEDIPEIDEDELNETMADLENVKERSFIISGVHDNKMPQFVHRTYAEFLCAKYLAGRKKMSVEILEGLLEQEDLLRVKYFFDVIVCQDLKLHFAVLLKNTVQIETCLDDERCLEERDKLGRTILHVASSYMHYHSDIHKIYFQNNTTQLHIIKYLTEFTIPESIYIQLVSKIQKFNVGLEDKWKNNPLDYSLKSRSFDSLDILLKYFPKSFTCEDVKCAIELIFVAALYDYPHVFKALKDCHKFDDLITNPDFENLALTHHNLEGTVDKYSLINICARNGSWRLAEAMLKNNLFEINYPYNAGKCVSTILETAVEEWNVFDKNQDKHLTLISMLIENGAVDIIPNENLDTILHHLALKIGYDNNNIIMSVIPTFLKAHNQTYINSTNNDGGTALMLALQYAHSKASVQFISTLIQFGANLRHEDKNGNNLWHYLANNILINDETILHDISTILAPVKHLINCPSKNNMKPLEHIIFIKRNEEIRKIMNIYFNRKLSEENKAIKIKNRSLHLINTQLSLQTVEYNFKHRRTTRQLIKRYIMNEADVRFSRSVNIWHYLVWTQNLNVTEFEELASMIIEDVGLNLLDEQEAKGNTPLLTAVYSAGNDPVSLFKIKYLIAQGASVNKINGLRRNFWHVLGFNNNLNNEGVESVATTLYDNGKQIINDGDIDGNTPLMIATFNVRNDSVNLIKYLLHHGANTQKKNRLGRNVWHNLTFNSNLNNEGIESVTSCFGDEPNGIDEVEKDGRTPLMFAVQNVRDDSVDLIKFLIKKGVNVRKKNNLGRNVWHCLTLNDALSKEGIESVTEILLPCFGDGIDEGDQEGDTPLMYSLQFARKDSVNLIKFLLDHQADIYKKNNLGRNLWHFLGFNEDLDNEYIKHVIETLLSYFGDDERTGISEKDNEGSTILEIAVQFARNNSTDLIKYLLGHGANIYNKNIYQQNIWHNLALNKNLNNGGLSNVLQLLQNKEDIMDEDDENGKTPLMTAIQEARNDSTDLIKYLIEAGADVHKKSKLGRNVWHWLALNDNLNNEAIKNVAKTLEPKIIDVEEEDGYTPLLIALREVRTESTDFIKYLIENKANIHKKNKEGQNIWHCLACNNKLNNVGIENVTKILTSSLNEIDEEDENGVTPLMIAIENARNDSIDLIQYLKEHGANMGKRSNLGRNIWHFLAFNNLNKEGIENVTKLLLNENGIDEEDFEGSTPLLLAIQLIKNDSVFLIKYLIECGVNIYKTNNLSQNIWHYLCFNNNLNKEAIEEVVEILSSSFNGDKIENIDDQDENGVTPLMVAVEKASNDSVSLIKYLIKQGANIYKRTSLGQNIWYCLSFNNNLNKEAIEEVLKILKSSFNGDNIGNIDEQDENGATPLMVAVQRANNDSVILVKYLVEHKANIYKRTILGRNIWHYLGFNNQLKNEGVNSFVKMLLHYFGDNKRNGINEEDEEGSTPLRIAVQHATNDSVNLIKCLLECGANVHMKNKHGQNVWHWLGFNKNLEGIENVANILMSCSSDNEPNGIDEEDEKGFTPLMIALQEARNNTINLIKYLVEHGASIHKKNKLGRNVWHLLGFNKDLNNEGIENIANILMSCSSDNEPNGIDEEDEKGFTPLMIALQEARNNSTNLIKYLVEHGASIHKKNKLGRDVWHCLGFNRNLNNEVKKDIAILIFSLGVNQD